MRTLDVIDSELRLLAAVRRAARDEGAEPSTELVDALLDERHHAAASVEVAHPDVRVSGVW